jgi:hypothetical protein
MMVSLFVMDMGCSRGFHQTETASADSMESTLSRFRQVVMDRTGKMKLSRLPRYRRLMNVIATGYIGLRPAIRG